MADFQSVKSHFNINNLSYYTFCPKFEKLMKEVLRHLTQNTPAEDKYNVLVSLGFDVFSVRQMTVTRRSPPERSKTINLPLFLIKFPGTSKPQGNVLLQIFCHIAIRVEACRAQNYLTQCHNCQQFGHVWATCKQPPLPVVRGRSPAQVSRREREYIFHTNMLQLSVGGRRDHPVPQTGEADVQRKKPQKISRTTTGKMFSFKSPLHV
jgi:hypothetical protein